MNNAIKLAIEKGGYKHPTIKYDKKNNWWEEWDGTENTQIVGRREVYAVFAQDPLFWQALGKALGKDTHQFETVEGKTTLQTYCTQCFIEDKFIEQRDDSYPCEGFNEAVLKMGRQYFDLVLTDGDTEKFWKELLSLRA